MQVTQVSDHVTHAIIGGQEAMSYGISDDPEMFIMLSSSLYSEKELAVVRETLCNGWDAHIDSGKTDTPLQVTLTNEHLVIRDFGPGIPMNRMQEIYCIYGRSTKKQDGKQTGGFGLGCKAPWAYADHFEVTVWHAGTKTIYRASKSSAENNGKPALVPIVSVPCGEETGLQVKIDLKERYHSSTFSDLIKRIAAVGDMNVELNGKKLPTLPFSQAKHDFLITEYRLSNSHHTHKIWVRYGNVVYPVENHGQYKHLYDEVTKMLGWLQAGNSGYGYREGWQIVLMAQPNTISVTPSRESLSMTDFTITTLHDLLQAFSTLANSYLETKVYEQAQLRIQEAFEDMAPERLLKTGLSLPFSRRSKKVTSKTEPDHEFLTDVEQISQAYIRKQYPSFKDFRRRDIEMRLRALIQFRYGGLKNLGKLQTFLADYLQEQKAPMSRGRITNWLQRRIFAPLLTQLKNHPDLAPERLWVYGPGDFDHNNHRRRYQTDEITFTEASKFARINQEDCLPFLRNFVVLTHNRIDVTERAPHFPAMKLWFGPVKESLVYVVQRSEPKIKAARELFEAHGYQVIDLTRRQKWEPKTIRDLDDTVREYKPRPKGLPKATCLIKPNGAVSWDNAKADGVERTETPEFIVKMARKDIVTFELFDRTSTGQIVRLFGARGGVVVNETQADKYKDGGAKDLLDFLLEAVPEEIETNPRIQQYLAIDPKRSTRISHYGHAMDMLKLIVEDEVLRVYYNVDHQMTADDFAYLYIWANILQIGDSKYRLNPKIQEANKKLTPVPVSNDLETLADKLSASRLVGMIGSSELQKLLQMTKKDEATRLAQAKARDILIYTIKG